VIERAQMANILREQGFQQTGCTDVTCAVEVGKILSASKILIGNVIPLGKSIVITGRIVDVESGVAEHGEKEVATSEENLPDAVVQFVDKLAERIGSGKVKAVVKKKVEEKKDEPKTDKGATAGDGSSRHLIGFGPSFGFTRAYGKYDLIEGWAITFENGSFTEDFKSIGATGTYFYELGRYRFGITAGYSYLFTNTKDVEKTGHKNLDKDLDSIGDKFHTVSAGPSVIYKPSMLDGLLIGMSANIYWYKMNHEVANRYDVRITHQSPESGFYFSVDMLLGYEITFSGFFIDVLADAGYGFKKVKQDTKYSTMDDHENYEYDRMIISRLSIQFGIPVSF